MMRNIGFIGLNIKENAKDTAPTILGLLHSIEQYKLENITTEEFIN